jgi:uroporphyrinogen decarboxylase
MLEKFAISGGTRLVGNLGHGMMPSHDPEMLRVYFDTIHRESREMLKASSS